MRVVLPHSCCAAGDDSGCLQYPSPRPAAQHFFLLLAPLLAILLAGCGNLGGLMGPPPVPQPSAYQPQATMRMRAVPSAIPPAGVTQAQMQAGYELAEAWTRYQIHMADLQRQLEGIPIYQDQLPKPPPPPTPGSVSWQKLLGAGAAGWAARSAAGGGL